MAMTGEKTVADFLRTLIEGMVAENSETAFLDCVIPFARDKARVQFEVTITGVEKLSEDAAAQGEGRTG